MHRHAPAFDHFALDRVVGYGDLGIVYRAKNRETGETVALKVLRPHWKGNEKAEELFLRGPVIASQVRHDHVVGIREIGMAGGQLYYTLEWVDGPALAQVLRNDLPLEERLRIVSQLARAVDHLHRRGVAHNDLKPSNILMAEGRAVKITDFEAATLRAGGDVPAPATRAGDALVCGTPPYMPPEAFRRALAPFDPRRDVYGLGVIAYRIVTGVLPFAAPDLMRLMQLKDMEPPAMDLWDVAVAPRLEATIRRALMPDAADRWGSAADFAGAVEGYLKTVQKAPRPAARPASGRSSTRVARINPFSITRRVIDRAACL